MPDPLAPLVTCEHGGNRIPDRYTGLFEGQEELLASHRGWDPGALELAREVARGLKAPLYYSQVSRLLVELNRSPRHPNLFSSVSRGLSAQERRAILERYYHPYREGVAAAVGAEGPAGRAILHLAIHSFTPVLDGEVRKVEVGLLYDPSRPGEKALARDLGRRLTAALSTEGVGLRVRMNQPYRGTADGLTTWLRKSFPPDRYLGLEVEVSQGLIREGGHPYATFRRAFLALLREAAARGVPEEKS